MALHQLIQTEARNYLVADDAASTSRALVIGAAQDALTGEAVSSPLHVSTVPVSVRVKVVDNRLFCLTGDPARVFPHLNAASLNLDITLRADGYSARAIALALAANAFFPIHLPAPILLDPLPTRLRGRVMTKTATPTPIANALITIVDPTLPQPDHVLVLRSPLRLSHASNTPIRERALTPTGSLKHLLAPAAASSQTLVLDQRTALAANTVLRLGVGTVIEYAVVANLNPIPANPNLPGEVYLHYPLYRSFAAGSEVTAITVGAISASAMLNRAQDGGEALLILNSAFTADTIEIADGDPVRVEYHAVGARTEGDGYYMLDGIGRVLNAQARAESGAQNATRTVRLNYRRGITLLDFAL